MSLYYEDDAVRLYHGDCLAILPTLASVDHVVTDPPYGVDVYLRMRSQDSKGGNRKHRLRGVDSLISMRSGAIGAVDDLLLPCAAHFGRLAERWVLVFSDAETAHAWKNGLESSGLRYVRTGAWLKPDAMPQMTGDRPGVGFEPCTIAHAAGEPLRWNGGGKQAVWSHNIVKGAARWDNVHPCPKPEPLMRELVALFTGPGDTILDPFAGSGTTGVAAKRLGRKAILIEREEKYCEVAAKRLERTVYEPSLLPSPNIRAKQLDAFALLDGPAAETGRSL